MCGLAGYNVNPEWAESKITPKKMVGVLQEAWLHNLHRGYDAAGYMLVEPDNSMTTFKSPGDAVKILQSSIYPLGLPIAKTLGAHTRNPTLNSSVDNNGNNHPVTYDKIWVTHNGTISNSDVIKASVRKASDKLPDVDSVAIPMLLSELSSPYDFQTTLRLVGEMQGGFVFHAIWEDFPATSLIVRGTNQPLVAAYNEDIGLFYGSEPESVWHMLFEIGGAKLANAGNWQWRNFHTNVAILMDNGRVLEQNAFSVKSLYESNQVKAPSVISRMLPREPGRKSRTVYSTDTTYDFAHKTAVSMHGYPEVGKVVYTRAKGATQQVDQFPRSNGDIDVFGVLSEADYIQENGTYIHAFFGDIEIVMTNGRVIKDVYNHKLFKNSQRWKSVKKTISLIQKTTENFEDFNDFFARKATQIKPQDIPKEVEKYEYVIRQEEEEKKKLNPPKALPSVSNPSTSERDINTEVISEVDSDGKTKMTPQAILTWPNIQNATITGKVDWMIFLADGECTLHNQKFTNHTLPAECFIVRNAATWSMAAFEGVDLYAFAAQGAEINWEFTDDYCPLQAGVEDSCWWHTTTVAEIHTKKAYWEIPIKDTCYICGSTRELMNRPKWFEKLWEIHYREEPINAA